MYKKLFKHPAVFLLTAFALAALLLCGCKAEDLTRDVAEAPNQSQQKQSPGKPGAPVSLENPQPFYVDEAGIYEFEIGLLVSSPIETSDPNGIIRVLVSSESGVELISTPSVFEFVYSPTGEYRLPLKVNVQKLGRHYIKLHIALNENGQISTRSLIAIVQAGNTPVKAQKATTIKSSAANDVISLPAQESISSH